MSAVGCLKQFAQSAGTGISATSRPPSSRSPRSRSGTARPSGRKDRASRSRGRLPAPRASCRPTECSGRAPPGCAAHRYKQTRTTDCDDCDYDARTLSLKRDRVIVMPGVSREGPRLELRTHSAARHSAQTAALSHIPRIGEPVLFIVVVRSRGLFVLRTFITCNNRSSQ